MPVSSSKFLIASGLFANGLSNSRVLSLVSQKVLVPDSVFGNTHRYSLLLCSRDPDCLQDIKPDHGPAAQ
jgi:hypothetical protein